MDLVEENEFQAFVAQATGRRLPMFGYNLFTGVPTTFAPVDRVPVTPDYVIGPGDQILIRAWGQVDVDFAATVDRNGQITIPRVGTLTVAGLRFQDLHGFLRNAIGRIYRNFELNVTMGELRSIQIFVVGHAARPGSYTVSALSTLVNAVFASGGPSPRGSMRRIQLKRGNQTVVEFDMYDLLVFGDKSKDVRLLPGDVIYYPPIGPLAALSGSVNTQAIFELKDRTSLDELIRLAGGFTTIAHTQKALVERIVERRVRRVEELTLDAAGLSRLLADGDVITIASITPRFENAVRLQGNVAAPARYPWRPGMRVTDLLVDENALIPSAFWQRLNQGVIIPRYTQREINFDFATLQRFDPKDMSSRLYAFNLGKAIRGDPTENMLLQPGDIVTIYGFDEALPRTENDVALQGTILGVGPRRFPWRPGMRLRDLIPDAKWLTEYYRYWLATGGASGRTEINWDYAALARLKPEDLSRQLLPFDLGRAILQQDATQNLALRARRRDHDLLEGRCRGTAAAPPDLRAAGRRSPARRHLPGAARRDAAATPCARRRRDAAGLPLRRRVLARIHPPHPGRAPQARDRTARAGHSAGGDRAHPAGDHRRRCRGRKARGGAQPGDARAAARP
ncbi:MAG: SLBB domain-containing protein [Burkholderiales bacterium]|nr:SLBB domain-containing protein [Burkholderiales bacterium]